MDNEELMRRFGPKLIDAIIQVMVEENNILREKLKFSRISNAQIIEAISKKLESITDYNWMKL